MPLYMMPSSIAFGLFLSFILASQSSLNQSDVKQPWFHDADNYWDFDFVVNKTVEDIKGGRRSKIIGDYDLIPGPKDKALELIHGVSHSKSLINLGDFSDTCLPDPGRCHSGFTISFWVNLKKVLNDGVLLQLGMSRKSRGITINTSYKEGKIYLIFYGNTPERIYKIEAELWSHIWHHIVLVWNATAEPKFSLFVNCTSGTKFKTTINNRIDKKKEDNDLIVGANHGGKKPIPIAVDDFAIWFKTLKRERFCQMINEVRVHGNYSAWTKFSSCSGTCGVGTKTRKRLCNNPVPRYGGRDCSKIGLSSETIKCNATPCPIPGGYTSWSNFSQCSVSCGEGGVRYRTRNCTNPKPQYGGQNCSIIGPAVEEERCNSHCCPIPGGYTSWSNFSKCSVSCGEGGTRYRTRNCTNPVPKHGGKNCSKIGSSFESEACNNFSCPVHGNYTAWSAFSSCSTSCGNGFRTRNRNCSNPVPQHGGRNCSTLGSDHEKTSCNLGECPVHGGYSEWSEFSVCSQTCGNASKTRTRTCNNPTPSYGGRDCESLGPNSDTVSCDTLRPCPVHGNYSEWSDFSPCEKTCGNSSKFRRRFCANPEPSFGGNNCSLLGKDFEQVPCYETPCPVHGNFSEWSEFSRCSRTCGNSTKERYRNCSRPAPMHGGNNCSSLGPNIEVRNCSLSPCPVNGNYSQWSEFSQCTHSCGNGTQFRTRQCNNPAPRDGLNCSMLGPSNETRLCKTHPCPINGNFSDWSEFSGCSKTCGSGVKFRYRYCTNPEPRYGGTNCSGPTSDKQPCHLRHCPINGNYSSWSSFGRCSKTCDNGTQVRIRYCTKPSPKHGGRDCNVFGPNVESRPCETQRCPDIDFMVKFKLNHTIWSDELLDNSSNMYQDLSKRLKSAVFGLHEYTAIKDVKIVSYSLGSAVVIMEVIYYSQGFPGAIHLYDAFYKDQKVGLFEVIPLLFASTDVPTNFVQNFTASNRSSTSLDLQWSPLSNQPGQDAIEGYVVIFKELPRSGNKSSNKMMTTVFLNDTKGRLDNLKKYSWYEVRIAGMNRRGFGVPSDPLIVLTDEDVPNASPNLKPVAFNTSSTSLNISWKTIPRSEINGILLEYVVFYKPNTSEEVHLNKTVPPVNLSTRLTGLRKYTKYEVRVAGSTSKGTGTMSARSFAYTDEDVPSSSPVFHSCTNITSTSIKLQWDKVPSNHQNGVILGYHIRYRPSFGNGSWNETVVRQENQTYLIVNNLTMYSWYIFRISAFTRKGEGKESKRELLTDEYVPCLAPELRGNSSESSTSIRLVWQNLSSCYRGILRGYVVSYKKKNEPPRNITVPPSSTEAVLKNLQKYTMYEDVKVAGFTSKGRGPYSKSVDIRTGEDVPSTWPKIIHAMNTSSTSIQITWNPIPQSNVHGILEGYRIQLKKANESYWEEEYNITKDDYSKNIENLWKYTKYVIRIVGFTSIGDGPYSPEVTVWTDEDVPSRPPEHFKTTNNSSPTSIPLTWKPIGDSFYIHGILLGYKIEFQMTHLAGNGLNKHSEINVYTTSNSTLSFDLKELEIYAVYRIKIRAFTVKGDGVASEIYAETCKCASVYNTNWWINPPYIYKNDSKVSGIFPAIIPRMVSECCEVCHEHGRTVTRFENQAQGGSSYLKSGVSEFRDHVSDQTELHFPMYGQVHQEKYYKQYEFIPLVKSPGVIFLVLEDDKHIASIMLLKTIQNTFPIVLLIIVLNVVVGIVFWFVETPSNKSQFPPSFISGVYQGIWLSIVSMTTIGYGDRFPRSIAGRIVGILWVLIGCLIVSLYTSIVTTNITTEVVSNQLKLYGTKVAVIMNSSEYQLAVRKNAQADLEHSYNNLNDIYNALKKRYVKGALIDAYVLGSRRDLFDNIGVRIHKIYDYSTAYGLVLAGEGKKLQQCFRQYVSENRRDIFQIIEANINMIKESEVTPSVQRAKSLIDATFIVYKQCLLTIGVPLCFTLLLGFMFQYSKKSLKRILGRAKFAKALLNKKPQRFSSVEYLQYEMRKALKEINDKLKKLKSKHECELKQWIKLKKSVMQKRRISEDSRPFSSSVVRYEEPYNSPLLQLRKLIGNGRNSTENHSSRSGSSRAETIV